MDVERASERVSGPGLLDASNNRAEGTVGLFFKHQ
jgi:hypothetical protein